MEPRSLGSVSRRRLLTGGAALVALPWSWQPHAALAPGSAGTTCAAPADFPSTVELYQSAYRNWVGAIQVDDVWTCAPRTPADVATVVNWAAGAGYRVRVRGFAHGWSPLTITQDTGCGDRVLLLDTTRYLTAIDSPGPGTVRAQAGASLDNLLVFLEGAGYGLTATPAPGDLSVGGALAIDAHGTAVPAAGEVPVPGDGYGSLSNRIVSLTAVVWDGASGSYQPRTFTRSDPGTPALLTHLGRALVTEATLHVRADYHLRCVSDVSIPASELFGYPAPAGARTFASYVESSGRVEAIWFPFTDRPWLKVWSLSPQRPVTSRPTTTPYNYPFADNVPRPVAELAGRLVSGEWYLAPAFGQAQYDAAAAGLTATAAVDLWGLSKNLLLYVRPTTMRMHANGYAVLTRRADIQRVVGEFVAFFSARLASYAAAGRYPVNGPVEIRVTGLDTPVDSADPPALSAIRIREDHPEWDTAVWLDLLTLPATPDLGAFYREIEQFVFTNYTGGYATARPEWSKGWAYTVDGPWTDHGVIAASGSDTASFTLDGLDPHRVFSNSFLDSLLP